LAEVEPRAALAPVQARSLGAAVRSFRYRRAPKAPKPSENQDSLIERRSSEPRLVYRWHWSLISALIEVTRRLIAVFAADVEGNLVATSDPWKDHIMSKRENDANNAFRPSDRPLTEYEAEQKALRKNLERLRAERLAREKAKSKDT
jgi:hypothetical protein